MFIGKYGGDVILRGGKDTFYRGGGTTAIYREGVVTNLKTFRAAVIGKDTSNPTVAPSVTSNLVAIMGRVAAQEHRTVTWSELLAMKKPLQADLASLVA